MPYFLYGLFPIFLSILLELVPSHIYSRRDLDLHTPRSSCTLSLDSGTTQKHSLRPPVLSHYKCPQRFHHSHRLDHQAYLYRIYHQSWYLHSSLSRLLILKECLNDDKTYLCHTAGPCKRLDDLLNSRLSCLCNPAQCHMSQFQISVQECIHCTLYL